MTKQEAKALLVLYRPGMPEEQEEGFAEAIHLTRTDPELAEWFERHCAVQQLITSKFRGISVPEGLKEQIISERKVRLVSNARRKTLLTAAALVVVCVLVGLSSLYFGPHEDYSLANFRMRMVGLVERQYPAMDVETKDQSKIRQYFVQKEAHGDYILPKALENSVSSTGCAIVRWKGATVSMICFNSGKKGTADADLYLFIIDRSAVTDGKKGGATDVAQVSSYATATWSTDKTTYVLAANGDAEFLKNYMPDRIN